ncbi:anti-sigma factor [Luteipulveratus halotolerans]|uniref:Regulator of SigK n=1 Tax=Luteipulveratus halotolerans TaxID=1631356 RepID=A0A0L6CFV9_9MICO|nr:anti-sigma factor [Luteipulveratus halotolerans]KNX36460.1 hypothetical protein VV01_03725 [Luteipulveratus halotolerans]
MNDDIHEPAAAYALGAVDDIERASFERHLRTCERCRAEVASYDEAVLSLATSAPEVAPPPSLKASVMAALPPQEPSDRRTAPRTAPARPWLTRTRVLVAAAAVAVLAVIGVGVAQPWQQPTSVAALSPAERVRLSADAQQHTAAVGDARLVVTTSRSAGAATVQTERMPDAPKGHVYQAWFLDAAGTPRSAGIMTGAQPQLLQGTPGASLAVTVEPTGGSAAPTTAPVVRVSLV